MLKLVVCIIILTAVCDAQEHLTCLRTDDVSNYNQQINLLRDQLNLLSQEVEAQKNQSRKNRQLSLTAILGNGLYLHPHIYIYQLTPDRQSWQASQEFCQNWGGNLATHGMKTLENRKKIIQMLSIRPHFWIGVNDIAL